MKVKIRYFGRFAAEIGKFYEEMEMEDDAKIRDLIEILRNKYSFLQEEIIEVSVDGKYASPDDPVAPEISVFPIISGG